jgi:hypothetical protein
MATTPEECLDALREAAERLEESPTKAAYEELGLQPASATIIRQVGGWNVAKEQAGLETNASTGSRVGPRPDDVDVSDEEWAEMTADRRWDYRNRERNAQLTLKRRARHRAWVNERKAERGCRRCGEDDPACLDLHHTDPAAKERAVGKLITHGHGRERLREELDACEVLCANCHRREHHDTATDGLRGWVHAHKATRGCGRCDEDDPVALDCHHDGAKRTTVARLLANGRPYEIIREEVARCVVLCANCHRREHHEPPAPDEH